MTPAISVRQVWNLELEPLGDLIEEVHRRALDLVDAQSEDEVRSYDVRALSRTTQRLREAYRDLQRRAAGIEN